MFERVAVLGLFDAVAEPGADPEQERTSSAPSKRRTTSKQYEGFDRSFRLRNLSTRGKVLRFQRLSRIETRADNQTAVR